MSTVYYLYDDKRYGTTVPMMYGRGLRYYTNREIRSDNYTMYKNSVSQSGETLYRNALNVIPNYREYSNDIAINDRYYRYPVEAAEVVRGVFKSGYKKLVRMNGVARRLSLINPDDLVEEENERIGKKRKVF